MKPEVDLTKDEELLFRLRVVLRTVELTKVEMVERMLYPSKHDEPLSLVKWSYD